MRVWLWWPTLHKDVVEFVKQCDKCQSYKAPICRDKMPLRPMMGVRTFAKWGINFVGPIDPPVAHTHALVHHNHSRHRLHDKVGRS